MSRYLITKRIEYLFYIAVSLWLFGTLPDELAGHLEPSSTSSDRAGTPERQPDGPPDGPAERSTQCGVDLY